MATGPTINRHKSNQSHQTPVDFMEAVKGRFGELSFDLAASSENTQAIDYFSKENNSLQMPWDGLKGTLWLNPPFADITPWAKKCAGYNPENHSILLLVPASIGSEWFRQYVHPFAYTLALSPRLKFVGCKDAYPKDCMLSVYSRGLQGFNTWRWK